MCSQAYEIVSLLGLLKTRVKEHTKAIATLDENSLLAKHHMLHSHQTDLESVEIVDLLTGHRRGDKD